ncbi:carbohydrate esterase family 16 protein [Leptodontidium sp. MPI-SDFR-AT-0119]|nr:carbohydrate esterase family 16 protein [Leptodontidium sp. MPI-SDFR-AT-0119]
MQFLTLGLLAASAALSTAAYNRHRGVGSHSKSWSWIKYFDNLVTFGDSYTDESRLGYFISHNGTTPPAGLLLPKSTSTAGGGITWGRWVSNYTSAKLYNYAVSGANSLYTDRHEGNTVYSMWIGTNNLGSYAFLTDSNSDGTTIPDYVDCIFKRFNETYKNGGRYFVLMNTAPLELSPLYGVLGKGGLAASHYWAHEPANGTEISFKMKEYTYPANSVFSYRTPYELLIAKRYPGASFAVFDVHSLITDIYNNPSDYLASLANVTRQYYVCDVATGSKCTSSSLSLDHYLWYDELHPSEKTDQVIAKEFAKVVNGSN